MKRGVKGAWGGPKKNHGGTRSGGKGKQKSKVKIELGRVLTPGQEGGTGKVQNRRIMSREGPEDRKKNTTKTGNSGTKVVAQRPQWW